MTLLTEKRDSVTEIAVSVGFESFSGFTRSFSPIRWRDSEGLSQPHPCDAKRPQRKRRQFIRFTAPSRTSAVQACSDLLTTGVDLVSRSLQTSREKGDVPIWRHVVRSSSPSPGGFKQCPQGAQRASLMVS